MTRRPAVPVVRCFAFVMPISEAGSSGIPVEEWAGALQHEVYGWVPGTPGQWVRLAIYDGSEFRAAKSHARDHHEETCEALGIEPYEPRPIRNAPKALTDTLDTKSNLIYQKRIVTGRATNL